MNQKAELLLLSFDRWKEFFKDGVEMKISMTDPFLRVDYRHWRECKEREVLMDLRYLTCPELF